MTPAAAEDEEINECPVPAGGEGGAALSTAKSATPAASTSSLLPAEFAFAASVLATPGESGDARGEAVPLAAATAAAAALAAERDDSSGAPKPFTADA